MSPRAPHFLLYSAADASPADDATGRWRFVLRTEQGETRLTASDDEPETSAERLQLLAIVRGLEAIDEPARVTLVGASRSIRRGMRQGLEQWRENDWQWERYGQWTPVKNSDLWRRIDRAMAIHQVACRDGLDDAADDLAAPTPAPTSLSPSSKHLPARGGRRLRIDTPARQLHPQPIASRVAVSSGWRARWTALAGRLGSLVRPLLRALRT
ncbi:MAG: RNase H family protein [Pirellulaceae bacterium]|nr:RNase H family protein [Pirellulaceae bacterium]